MAQLDLVGHAGFELAVSADRVDHAIANQNQTVFFINDAIFCRVQEGVIVEAVDGATQREFGHKMYPLNFQ